tara:strand:+ start:1824 stop:2153 length:330 start_codon:yes stop_codon:yes gene_type:complete
MMNKFLVFIDAADDAACYPVENLLAITCASDGAVNLKFKSSIGSGGTDGASADTVALTVTADTEKTVFSSIVSAINAHPNGDPFVVVADDVNSVYVDSNISACAITLDT